MVQGEKLDERDIKILNILAGNARETFTKMAREVGISDVAVIKRVKKLEGRVIRKYTIVVKADAVGYGSFSFTGLDVDPERLFAVIEELRGKDYVKGLWLTTGDHQIMALIAARDEEGLARIHGELANIAGVKRVCPTIVLRTLKEVEMVLTRE